MKKLYLLIFITTPLFLQAQRDSALHYQKQIDSLYRSTYDSLRNSEAYLRAYDNYWRVSRKTKGYGGFSIFMDLYHSDYSQFNTMLAQDGFAPLKDMGYRIGFGASFKMNRTMLDIYGIVAGLNNKTKKEDEKITTSFSNVLHFDLGYDLLNKRTVSIYPYGGLSLRMSNIRYQKEPTENPNYTSLADMLSGGRDISLESTRLGYQLGLGFDFTLFHNQARNSRSILFIKAGMNRPVGKDKYRHADLPEYKAGIKQGDYMITVGFKFAGGG